MRRPAPVFSERASQTALFNLTGTILHTNLGRAPLPREALDVIARCSEYTNVEYDLGAGQRGERDSHVESLLCELTGCEAATVVNNNAAALLVVLNTIAARRDVVVSRGELIEIGGSFRLPDLIRRSGCRPMEVGPPNSRLKLDPSTAPPTTSGPRTCLRVVQFGFQLRPGMIVEGD